MSVRTKPIPLCEYRDRRGRSELTAVLDEVTLTYSVVLRDSSGAIQTVRRHVPTLRAARSCALAYRDAVMSA
jgi:hypothetical protein